MKRSEKIKNEPQEKEKDHESVQVKMPLLFHFLYK